MEPRGGHKLLMSFGCLENIGTSNHCFAKWGAVICNVYGGSTFSGDKVPSSCLSA